MVRKLCEGLINMGLECEGAKGEQKGSFGRVSGLNLSSEKKLVGNDLGLVGKESNLAFDEKLLASFRQY